MAADNLHAESLRIIAAAQAMNITMRLLGGLAVFHLCPTTRHTGLSRVYKDIDLLALSTQRGPLQQLLLAEGYEPDQAFNLLNGGSRMIFRHSQSGCQIDIFLDHFSMCHSFDLRQRLHLHRLTLTPADLLLTKLQVVHATEHDLCDLFALLSDLPISSGSIGTAKADRADSTGMIDSGYIVRLAANDWGLYHTLELSLQRLESWSQSRAASGAYGIVEQIQLLRELLQQQPKSMPWKLRARLGERVRWYDIPEEVDQTPAQ